MSSASFLGSALLSKLLELHATLLSNNSILGSVHDAHLTPRREAVRRDVEEGERMLAILKRRT